MNTTPITPLPQDHTQDHTQDDNILKKYKQITDIEVPPPDTYFRAANVGWICPKCGRALSPSTTVCPCFASQIQVTCNSDETQHIVSVWGNN